MHSRASIALIASALFAGVAGAQSFQPVEWKVSDGGNGHWYQVCERPGTFWQKEGWAESVGGHLATIQSQAENHMVKDLVTSLNWSPDPCNATLGGYQDRGSPSYSEPEGGWRWVTGEPFSFTEWAGGEPNNNFGVGEDFLEYWHFNCGYGWNDGGDPSATMNSKFVVEWDTDCNGDGTVDYGQIQSGQLQDDNQNNVPDVCESTVTGVIPVSGASSGSTSVIINGTNFPQNPTVLIGGSAATNVVRVSANRITAVTPAGLPGMASVTVGNWVQPNAFYYRPECGSDLDQDGEVTASDIAIVLLDFGPCYATATSSQPEDSTPFMLREQADAAAPRAK